MDKFLKVFFDSYLNEIFFTFISVVLLIVIYTTIFFFIKRKDWSVEKKHKNAVSIRNIFFFLLAITLIVIWSGELKTFILSTTAIFGAMLLVFKEVILSLSGGILIGNSLNIGDYIEYDGTEGVIVDRNFFHTKVLTGTAYANKELIIPNIYFLTNKIVNTSRFGKLIVFKIEIGGKTPEEIFENSKIILEIAQKTIEPFKAQHLDYFKEKMSNSKSNLLFSIPQLDPKIVYHLNDYKKLSFSLFYIADPKEQEEIENKIYQEYFKKIKETQSFQS